MDVGFRQQLWVTPDSLHIEIQKKNVRLTSRNREVKSSYRKLFGVSVPWLFIGPFGKHEVENKLNLKLPKL